ncbi:MAG: glycosyltransferase [Bacteroidales bacterium]|nr:glycosyltransferase [Bacteroidales bacterium]
MGNEVNFIVRIECITYNHASYIVEAMNSFCMQQTNFPFLCVIADDASTDGEPEIIKKYIGDNFDMMKIGLFTPDETDEYLRIYARHKENTNCYFCAILLKYNHYSIKKAKLTSIADLIKPIEYIAMCEGDDYWTDPLKLQKQVDILEAHPEYSACFHSAKVINMNGGFVRHFHPNSEKMKQIYDFNDSIKGWNVPTASLVFRKSEAIQKVMSYVYKYNIISVDRLRIAAMASVGNYYYIPEEMCIYRKHPGGISSWGNRIEIFKSNIRLYEGLRDYFAPKYSKGLTNRIFEWHGVLTLEYYKQAKYLKYFKELFVTLLYVRSFIDFKTWVKNYLFRK